MPDFNSAPRAQAIVFQATGNCASTAGDNYPIRGPLPGYGMSTPSIRRIAAQSPEIPYLESYLDNSAISGGFSESGAPPAVPHRYDWMWLERWNLGSATRMFAVIGPNPRNETRDDDAEIISSLRNGARVYLNLGEASIVEIGLGDYGNDGVRDILLRLSDGAFLLITPSEESQASSEENPPTVTAPPSS